MTPCLLERLAEGPLMVDGASGIMRARHGLAADADVRAAVQEQARALAIAGADAIIIETQTALDELGLALRAAREAGVPCAAHRGRRACHRRLLRQYSRPHPRVPAGPRPHVMTTWNAEPADQCAMT